MCFNRVFKMNEELVGNGPTISEFIFEKAFERIEKIKTLEMFP